MIPSDRCVALVKSFEGYFDHAYRCPAGVWTIGYGTTHYPSGAPVKDGDKCTRAQAEDWLRGELELCSQAIERSVKVELKQGQFDALTSFIYNVGPGAFAKSTLLKLLNAGSYTGAAEQFAKWNHGGGKELPGLTRRRAAERSLFLEA